MQEPEENPGGGDPRGQGFVAAAAAAAAAAVAAAVAAAAAAVAAAAAAAADARWAVGICRATPSAAPCYALYPTIRPQ